jgi:hypothetical protein
MVKIDLKKMQEVGASNEYEDIFKELDKVKNTLKTGTDIADKIYKLTNFPYSECVRLMTAYLLRKK